MTLPFEALVDRFSHPLLTEQWFEEFNNRYSPNGKPADPPIRLRLNVAEIGALLDGLLSILGGVVHSEVSHLEVSIDFGGNVYATRVRDSSLPLVFVDAEIVNTFLDSTSHERIGQMYSLVGRVRIDGDITPIVSAGMARLASDGI